MEDKPEKPDLPILSGKAYLTWNEVDGLLFRYAYKRNAHGNHKWTETLKNARRGVRDLFEEARLLNTGELKGESSTRGNISIYRKIKKGEMCAWLMEKRILDLLRDKGIGVPTENIKFIERAATVKKKVKLPAKPDTDKAKMKHLHIAYVSEVEKKIKKNKKLTNPDLLEDPELNLLIKESGLPKGCPSKNTFRGKWIPEARNNVKIPAPKGRPKKYPSL